MRSVGLIVSAFLRFAAAIFALMLGLVAVSPAYASATWQSPPSEDATYRLAPEDALTITVLRHPEFSGDFLVPDGGSIDVPAVGSVVVAGKTLADVQRIVAGSLAQTRLWKPEVTVTLKTARTRRVYVLGDVKLSGAYDWKPGWTVSQLLSSAGGLDTEVQRTDVVLTIETPTGAVQASLPYSEAVSQQDNPKLKIEPGDTLRVESLNTVPVYVAGEVIRPGLYRLRADACNVLAALSEAGGVTPDASLTVRLQRTNGSQEFVNMSPVLVLGKGGQNPGLKAGDMVIVAQNLKSFAVLGFVQKPGYFPIPEGRELRLSDAVATAQGATTTVGGRGRIVEIGLVRIVDHKAVHQVYDLSRFFRKGDQSQNPVIMAGDVIYVPKSNAIELDTVLTGIAAGGLLYYNVTH